MSENINNTNDNILKMIKNTDINELIKALDRLNDDRVELLLLTGNTTAFSSDYKALKQVLVAKFGGQSKND